MKVIFLDIDGVLNDCSSMGVFYEDSTIEGHINVLNEVLDTTGSKIVVISTWKDSYGIDTVAEILYSRGLKKNTIMGGTRKDSAKENGIKEFLNRNQVDSYAIIDDNLDFSDPELKNNHVKTETFVGITNKESDQLITLLS